MASGTSRRVRRRHRPRTPAPAPSPDEVAELLARIRGGDEQAHQQMFATLYESLRNVAHAAMMNEPPGATLEPTALVHEVFLNLSRRSAPWADRRHFFAVAARAMRHVLVDHARTRKLRRTTRTEESRRTKSVLVEFEDRAIDLILLDDALERLASGDERAARIVELRFFGGLSLPQVARTLSLPLRTVERDWQWARAFLHAQLA
jgi:RNA polymerase sigma factor (TIGR02999 family)